MQFAAFALGCALVPGIRSHAYGADMQWAPPAETLPTSRPEFAPPPDSRYEPAAPSIEHKAPSSYELAAPETAEKRANPELARPELSDAPPADPDRSDR